MTTKTIRELCKIVVDCPHSTPKWTDSGKIVVRNNNIKNGKIDFSEPSFTDEEHFQQRIKRAVPQAGDIIITREAPMGEVGMIPDGVECCLGQRMVLLRVDEKICDNYYLLYSLQSRFVQHQISWSDGTGTTVSNLRIPHLEKLQIPYIEIKEQQKVASVLKAIDYKIMTNQQINDNLQAQVSTLYRAWFEEFEPFGGICPSKWKLTTLSTIANIASGKRPPIRSSVQTEDATIPLVGAASIMGYTNAANYNSKILVTGRVGTHGVIQRFNSACWASDNTLVITSDYYEFVSQILQRIDYATLNRGSTQPLITQGDMKKVDIMLPDDVTLQQFEDIAGKLMTQYDANVIENVKLAEIRDALLPKLMSGEIEVLDI